MMKKLAILLILVSCSKNIKELINRTKEKEYWQYIREDKVKELEKYLENNTINLNETNEEGEIPLTLAAKYNSSNTVKFFLENKKINIDANSKNDKNQNALTCAILFNNNLNGIAGVRRYNIIDELLKKDANVNSRYGIGNNNTLMLAITKKDTHLIKKILDKNIDINTQNFKKETALILLTKSDMIEASKIEILEKMLSKKDMELNAQDNIGNTALIYSLINNNKNIFKKLIEKKEINIYLKNNKGKNIIHYILKNSDKDFIDIINKKFYNSKNLFLNIFLDDEYLNNFIYNFEKEINKSPLSNLILLDTCGYEPSFYYKIEINESLNSLQIKKNYPDSLQIEKSYLIKYILNHFYNKNIDNNTIKSNLDFLIIEELGYYIGSKSKNENLIKLIRLAEKYIKVGKYDLISSLISKLPIFNFIFLNNKNILKSLLINNRKIIENALESILNDKEVNYENSYYNLILKDKEKENFIEFILRNTINYNDKSKVFYDSHMQKEKVKSFLNSILILLYDEQSKLNEEKKLKQKDILEDVFPKIKDDISSKYEIKLSEGQKILRILKKCISNLTDHFKIKYPKKFKEVLLPEKDYSELFYLSRFDYTLKKSNRSKKFESIEDIDEEDIINIFDIMIEKTNQSSNYSKEEKTNFIASLNDIISEIKFHILEKKEINSSKASEYLKFLKPLEKYFMNNSDYYGPKDLKPSPIIFYYPEELFSKGLSAKYSSYIKSEMPLNIILQKILHKEELLNILNIIYRKEIDKNSFIENYINNFLNQNTSYKFYNTILSKELFNQFSIDYLNLLKNSSLNHYFGKDNFNLIPLNRLLISTINLNFEDLFFSLIESYSNSIVNLVDHKRNNTLHYAIKRKNMEIIKYILKNNEILLFKKNIKNKTPLHKILERRFETEYKAKLVEIFLNYYIEKIPLYNNLIQFLFQIIKIDATIEAPEELHTFLLKNFNLKNSNRDEEKLIYFLLDIFEENMTKELYDKKYKYSYSSKKFSIKEPFCIKLLKLLLAKLEKNRNLMQILTEVKNKNKVHTFRDFSSRFVKILEDIEYYIKEDNNATKEKSIKELNVPQAIKKKDILVLKEEILLKDLLYINYEEKIENLKIEDKFKLRRIIEHDFESVDWTYVNEKGLSLLLESLKAGYSKIFIENISKMKNLDKIINIVDFNGDNLLFTAIEINDTNFLKFLLTSKYIKLDKRFVNKDGNIALMYALKINNIVAADMILSENEYLDMLYWRNRDGLSAIDLALKNNDSINVLEIESKFVAEKIVSRENFDTSNYWSLNDEEKLGILKTIQNNLKEVIRIDEIKYNSLMIAANNNCMNIAKKLINNLSLEILFKAFDSSKNEVLKNIIVQKIKLLNPKFNLKKFRRLRKTFPNKRILSEDIYFGLENVEWSTKNFMDNYTSIGDEKINNIKPQKIENKSKRIRNKQKIKENKNKFKNNNNRINQPQKR